MEKRTAGINQSVERTFQIIEIIAAERGPMRLMDIAGKAGLPAGKNWGIPLLA